MPITREIRSISDSRRDAERYHDFLLAIELATHEIRDMGGESHPDIDEVLDRLLPYLAAALNAEQAFVAALREDEDRGKKWFELTAVYPRKDLRGHHLEWSDLLQQLIKDGKPRVIDPLGEEVRDPIPGLEIFDATSAVLVRMQAPGHVGVVGICNKAHPALGPFLAADRMALNSIVELVAIGAQVGERRRRELEGIQKTSAAISAELDLNELLPMIARGAVEVFGAPAASLMLWDESGENLVIKASWGLSHEYVQQQRICREKAYTAISPSGKFLPFAVEDLRVEPFGQVGQIERERLCSVLVVPLEISGEPIGALNIYSKDTPHQFTHDEKELARIFANQAVIAIQNAQVYQQVTQTAKVMESLEEVGRTITGDLDLHYVLRLIVENANEVLEADVSSVFLFDEGAEGLFPFGIANVHGTIEPIPDEGRPQTEGLAARVVRDKKLLVVEDVASWELAARSKIVVAEKILSFACCPLLAGEDVFGLLYVDFCAPHEFTDDELQTIQMFANQAAIAIKNARQYEDIEKACQDAEKAKRRLEIVVAIGRAVSSTLDFEEVLDTLLTELGQVIEAPDRGILLYDEASDEFTIHPSSYYNIDPDKAHITRLGVDEGITGWVAEAKEHCNVPDVTEDPRYLKLISTTRSELAVPVLHGDELVGVINLESPQPGAFDEEDVTLLQAIADQVAIAIRNVKQYETTRRQSQHWRALHEASKAITAGFTAERKQVLNRIVEQAVERITGIEGPKAVWSAIMLYDEAANELHFESVYSLNRMLPELEARLGEKWLLDRDKVPGGKIGIAGRTVWERKPQRVEDVRTDPDYLEFNVTTRSELNVPLFDGDRVIGVLGVESDQVGAFDEADEQALGGLAELAVIAIKNAGRQAELLKTRKQLAARSALAWAGMMSSTWFHAIRSNVASVRDNVELLRGSIPDTEEYRKHRERLERIDTQAKQVLEEQMVGPLPSEDIVESIGLNALVKERVICLHRPYHDVKLEWDLEDTESIRVRAVRRWLMSAIDYLVQNALDAMTALKEERCKRLAIYSRLAENMVEFLIGDTGPGIPDEVLARLGKEPIQKGPEEKGAGWGWLMVKMILQSYGGDAEVVSTGREGTTVKLSLPVEQK